MKILVLGASGFIGRNLAEFFAHKAGCEVVGVSHTRSVEKLGLASHVKADLREKSNVDKLITKDIDCILQFAATTSGSRDIVERPYIHVTDNAIINSLVFRRAYEVGVKKVIFPSCSVMYQSSPLPQKETDFDPRMELVKAYRGVGATKLYLERMCEFYSSLGRTAYVALRHSNIYGPHDKFDLERSHFTGATLRKVLDTPEGGSIDVWGDGSTKRDLLYVDDFIAAIQLLVTQFDEQFGLFNVGAGVSYSVREITEKIIQLSKKNIHINFDTAKPSINTNLSLDSTKFKSATGWEPLVRIEEGLARTLKWLKENYHEC